MKELPVSVILPTYNGKDVLEKYLPANLDAIFNHGIGNEVIVVDDGSVDGTAKYLEDNPKIKLVRLTENKGFANACNEGARHAQKDILFFLNNDAELKGEFVGYLNEALQDEKVFGVSPQVIVPSKGRNTGLISGQFRRGFMREDHALSMRQNVPVHIPVIYPCGAAFACKRDKFFKLGGFDLIYSPFFFEDFDLGYRAWKRGWVNVYEPRVIVIHHEQQTIGKNLSLRNLIYDRNRLIFHWKNLTDKDLFFKHVVFLIFKIILSIIKGDIRWLKAFWQAFEQRGKVREKRKAEKEFIVRGDNEILEIIKNAA